MTAAAALKHLNLSNSAACSATVSGAEGCTLRRLQRAGGSATRKERHCLFLGSAVSQKTSGSVGREAGTEPSTSVAQRVGGGTVTLQYLAGSLRLQPWNQAHLSCRGSSLWLFIYIYIYNGASQPGVKAGSSCWRSC